MAERTPVPRIRGANPPAPIPPPVHRIELPIVAVPIALAIAVVLGLAIDVIGRGLITVYGIGLIAIAFYFLRPEPDPVPDGSLPISLYAYNTEFSAPLADHTIVRVTVYFQMPSAVAMPVASGYSTPTPPLVEQLNRVTENVLIRFCIGLAEPPTAAAIDEYLQITLIQFQDENNLPVLRVNVPIVLHIKPDSPKGVYV